MLLYDEYAISYINLLVVCMCMLVYSHLYYTYTSGKETQAIHENVYCEIHIYVTSCEKQPVPVPALYRTMRPLAHEAKNKGIYIEYMCKSSIYRLFLMYYTVYLHSDAIYLHEYV